MGDGCEEDYFPLISVLKVCKCLELTSPHIVNLRGQRGNSIKFVDNI